MTPKHILKVNEEIRSARSAVREQLESFSRGEWKRIPQEMDALSARTAQTQADILISQLNQPLSLKQDAVVRLEDMLLRLRVLRNKAARGQPILPDELIPINEYLSRYRWTSQLLALTAENYGKESDRETAVTNPLLHFQDTPVWERGEGKSDKLEQLIADFIVDLSSGDKLERIQRCDFCQAWFHSRRKPYDPNAGTFCCTKHQQKFWRSKPEVKEKRKKYQLQYYKDELSPVTRKSRKRKSK
jgi:hypothetical protein